MTYVKIPKEALERHLQESEQVLERSRKVKAEIEQGLRESNRRVERIRADLRRAGLLRD